MPEGVQAKRPPARSYWEQSHWGDQLQLSFLRDRGVLQGKFANSCLSETSAAAKRIQSEDPPNSAEHPPCCLSPISWTWLWNLFQAQINDIPGEKLCAALNWTHSRTGVPDCASHCFWRTERPLEALAVYRMLQGFQKERPPERSHWGLSYHWFELFLSLLLLGYYFTPQATNAHLDKAQHGAQTQPYQDQPNSAKRINGSEFSISTSTCLLLAIDQMVQSFLTRTTDENGASIYQCIECGKMSKVSTNLKDHIEATHIQGLNLECDLCFKQFKSRGRLSFHIRTTHKHWNDSPCAIVS